MPTGSTPGLQYAPEPVLCRMPQTHDARFGALSRPACPAGRPGRRQWWTETFPKTPVGRWLRGLIPPTPEPFIYPACLLQSVEHDSEDERLAAVLLLLLGPA